MRRRELLKGMSLLPFAALLPFGLTASPGQWRQVQVMALGIWWPINFDDLRPGMTARFLLDGKGDWTHPYHVDGEPRPCQEGPPGNMQVQVTALSTYRTDIVEET
jgi:hypothetical protein